MKKPKIIKNNLGLMGTIEITPDRSYMHPDAVRKLAGDNRVVGPFYSSYDAGSMVMAILGPGPGSARVFFGETREPDEERFYKEITDPVSAVAAVSLIQKDEERRQIAINAVGPLDKKPEDVVNHPNHYAPNGVDSFMHMKDQMGKDAFDGFLQGNAIKYVQRYKFKGKPVEDLCKAAFYLFHLAFEAANEAERPALCDKFVKTLHHAADHFRLGGACGACVNSKTGGTK